MTSVGKKVAKSEPLCTVSGNVNMVQPPYEAVWRLLRQLKTESSYDPGILLLGIYPKITERMNKKIIVHLMFRVALFTIVKRRKQLTCSVADDCINKMWYIHMMEYYSALKTGNSDTCYHMDEP